MTLSVSSRPIAHGPDEKHHYYRQDLAPAGGTPLQVGDLWSDTTANLVKRCTNASTPTFISIETQGVGHQRALQIVVFDFTTDVATGDGKFYFHVDSRLAGMDLIDVHAEVITAGTTNTTDIQLRNVTQAADILSTKLTIDSTETGSDTAAAAAVINTAEDDMTENDVIAVDVDAVSTTAPKGLLITLGFETP